MTSTFAFLPTPLPGHVNPALAVARELTARGHHVTVHLPHDFRAAIATTGAHAALFDRPATLRDEPGAAPRDPLSQLAIQPFKMARAAGSVLPAVLPRLQRDPPDVLVHDALSVWGRVAAGLLPSEAAQACASYAMNEHFSYLMDARAGTADAATNAAVQRFADDMYALSRAYGTRPLNLPQLLMGDDTFTLVFVPEWLQPCAETFSPHRYRFVGPAIRAEHEPLDEALEQLGPGPTVYVSLGTVFNGWPEFYDHCDGAFSGCDWDVVIAGAPADRPTAATRIHGRERVPQLAMLARASVFVTHAGMNSTLEALAAGVPMVAIPQTPEQAVTARRLEREGAAIVIERDTVTPGTLRAAVDRALTDPTLRASAERLGRALRAGPDGAHAAADELERLAAPGLRPGSRAAR